MVRALTAATGLAALAYGVEQILSGGTVTDAGAVLTWLAGALLVHDGLLAPLALAVGWALARLLPATPRRVVVTGLFIAGCLVLVALPPLLAPGVPDNPTTTPRDYSRGLLVWLGVDLLLTLAVLLAGLAVRRRRQARQQSQQSTQ